MHFKKVYRFCVLGNGCNMYICHLGIFISHQKVLVLAVWVSGSGIVPEINMGGGGEKTTINIAFIVSIESGSPCNF